MNAVMTKLAPSATNMIRFDHTHVLATFHQYQIDTAPSLKRVLASTLCMALEIHAEIEEEIFYPALRVVAADNAVLQKSQPEHDQMRLTIATLRALDVHEPGFDDCVMELMRDVMHHVADEETVLLPLAERMFGEERLAELGLQMTKRRLKLSAPQAGQMAYNTVRSMPAGKFMVAAGALVLGSVLLGKVRGGRGNS